MASLRRRILTRNPNVTGGGGGTTSGTAHLEWGPDFGNPPEFQVGVAVSMPEVSILNRETVGVTLTMPELALLNTKSVGAHLSGSVLGAPFWQSVQTATATNPDPPEITINKPDNVVEGDLLVSFIGIATLIGDLDINTPAGWTTIRGDVLITPSLRLRSFYKIATSSEPTTYTFEITVDGATSHILGEIHHIKGAHPTTPIDANTGATLLASALDPDPSAPAVTTVANDCLVFSILLHDHANLPQTHTAPANHVERTDFEVLNSNRKSLTSATRAFATPGAQAAVEFNCTEIVATDAVLQRISIAPGELIIA